LWLANFQLSLSGRTKHRGEIPFNDAPFRWDIVAKALNRH